MDKILRIGIVIPGFEKLEVFVHCLKIKVKRENVIGKYQEELRQDLIKVLEEEFILE
jgi:hypothetical protein